MKDHVNITNRQVDAEMHADTSTVTVESGEVCEVPLAAIAGG
ncbi:MAG TPA: hypothetical protein VJ984_10555 [Xanthomonadales bacterium]|nr:hypothetical protein [Xanthomonadales bacterium]